MDFNGRYSKSANNYGCSEGGDDMDVKRGPWTAAENSILINYIKTHGEGRWNSVAGFTGLRRTGKSCRLRWLNYLRPSVRRGNITPQEQLLILELHLRWGNRWSKIADFLPGRTDNEIKNYWRTRVQKQAHQLKCDVNSQQFRDAMRYQWMPRLVERIQAASSVRHIVPSRTSTDSLSDDQMPRLTASLTSVSEWVNQSFIPEAPASTSSADSSDVQLSSVTTSDANCYNSNTLGGSPSGSDLISDEQGLDIQEINGWLNDGDSLDGFWNEENIRFLEQQRWEDL